MQTVIARILESPNHQETKMFLLPDKQHVSKLEFNFDPLKNNGK